jgi:chlorobactene glucosyltransferase
MMRPGGIFLRFCAVAMLFALARPEARAQEKDSAAVASPIPLPPSSCSIDLNLNEQRAYLLKNGHMVADSPISSGREGHETPTGDFEVTQKDPNAFSNMYGMIVNKASGDVVVAGAEPGMPVPQGCEYVPAPMRWFMRFDGAVGMHEGNLPGYAASHGCVRMPAAMAKLFYDTVEVGTPVHVFGTAPVHESPEDTAASRDAAAPPMQASMVLLHVLILGVLCASLLGLGVNLLFFRSLAPATAATAATVNVAHGRVSILVPARNEERAIGDCVSSLLAQDYPDFELLLLDDGSTDRTAAIVAELMGGSAGHRLLSGAPLPEGWTGKNWACHQLSQAAAGEWLLFTDADTIHSPAALSAAVSMATQARADLFSAWPRLVTVTLGEKMVIPVLHVIALAWFPIALLQFLQTRPRLAARLPRRVLRAWGGANGQFVLFRREAYERIGGHSAIRYHIVEDVALGREVASRIPEGMRLLNCDGSGLVDCRMYHTLREVCDGFTKNARAAFEGNLATWYVVGALQFTGFFLPFVLLFFPSQFRLAAIEVGLIYLIRVILVLRMRTSWLGCILHPVGQFLAMAIAIRSWISTAGAGVQWKGRTYRLNLDEKPAPAHASSD